MRSPQKNRLQQLHAALAECRKPGATLLVARVALLHGSTRRSQQTQLHLSSFDLDGDRASELLHAVQDMDSDANFGGTTSVLAEA
jgi:hypothetical protein